VNGPFRDTGNTWSSKTQKEENKTKNTTPHRKLNDEQLNPHKKSKKKNHTKNNRR